MEANKDIRTAAKENGIKLWQIAAGIGINDGNFSRKLRRELSAAEKQRIFAIINELTTRNESEVG